jgi:uncharacterized protein (DUF1778 family)
MKKKDETTKKTPGRRKLGKMTFALRLRPTTKEILDRAASQAHTTSSDYAEEAILAKARKDGIT